MVKSNHAAVVLTPEGQDRCVRAVIRRIIAVHRRRTPGWARNASIVQLLLEHGEWKSVISGAKTMLAEQGRKQKIGALRFWKWFLKLEVDPFLSAVVIK
jgi:hypothetical protein